MFYSYADKPKYYDHLLNKALFLYVFIKQLLYATRLKSDGNILIVGPLNAKSYMLEILHDKHVVTLTYPISDKWDCVLGSLWPGQYSEVLFRFLKCA